MVSPANILVVDDDPEILNLICEILKKPQSYSVTPFSHGRKAIDALTPGAFELVITDLNMPEVDGMAVLDHVATYVPETLCMILTGFGTISGAVTALKRGAFDYITKPVQPSKLLQHVETALKVQQLKAGKPGASPRQPEGYHENFIGTSPAIKKIHRLIDKVADSDSTILVTGASGTGKEMIVRTIHKASNRRNQPFIAVNCGAIPEALLESEIFGHEKGAFTGAHKKRIGRFEMAQGGTIFLDEVAEMSPALQVKLLRVLQERSIERVGGGQSIDVDVRIIAATNKDLSRAVKEGAFREDLFYRLNVIPIHVPRLVRRRSDIPLLVDFFLERFQGGDATDIEGFSPEAMDALLMHDWPGNVRELENLIKRMIVLCDNSVVGLEDLPEHFQESAAPPSTEGAAEEGVGHSLEDDETILVDGMNLSDAVRAFESRIIAKALEQSDGVKAKAARLLNIKRTTLVEKIKKNKLLNNDD